MIPLIGYFLIISTSYAFITSTFLSRKNYVPIQSNLILLEKNPFNIEVSSDFPISNDISELPDSFEDAIQRAALRTIQCINIGKFNTRIDFDTSVGDQTSTSLKNSMPFIKEFSNIISKEYNLFPLTRPNASVENSTLEIMELDEIPEIQQPRLLKIFFPDMGAAVLARRDWKLDSDESLVPACVRTSNILNDPIDSDDKLIIILCPLYSEVDSVERVMKLAAIANVPCIMINPALINMDQGFGVRARNIRKNILNIFEITYKLRTMPTGAIVREWPAGFSVWNEDPTSDAGYTHLQSYARDPPRELVDDLFESANKVEESSSNNNGPANFAINTVKGVAGFFQGLSRL